MKRARTRASGCPSRGERGSVSVEAVLLIPALVIILGLVVGGWRIWSVRTNTTQAAAAGARAASLATSGSQASSVAVQVARENLSTLGQRCDELLVAVDVGAFARPPGEAAAVGVDVRCRVSLADLLVPGLPGHWTANSHAEEILDTFRERRP